jgi:hypothetical protein
MLSKALQINIYKTIFYQLFIYGCKLWTEEHELQVFKKILSKTSGPMKDEVCKQFRILHNEELPIFIITTYHYQDSNF